MAEVAEGLLSRPPQASRASGCAGVAVARHGYGRPTRVVDDDRGRPSGARRRRPESRRARARTGRRRGRRRSGAGADVGRRLGQLDRAGARRLVRRQAGGDARAAALGRQHRRDQHACANISRASRAGGWRATPIRRKLVTIAISDVPGDDPSAIGSGPTVPDPTTLADARAIVAKYKLDLPASGDARARRCRQ